MIEVKLKAFLDAHNVSVYELAQAIADETQSLSETSVYKIVSGSRNPSLASLDLMLAALRELTRQDVQVQDVLVYVPDTGAPELQENHDELAEVWALVQAHLPLVPTGVEAEPQPLQRPPAPKTTVSKRLRQALLAVTLGGTLLSLSLGGPPELSTPQSPSRTTATTGLGVPPPLLRATPPVTLTPKLKVIADAKARAYDFQLINSASGQVLISVVVPEGYFRVPPTYLCAGIPYAWSARVQTPGGWSSYATPVRFRVAGGVNGEKADADQLIPPAPALLFPSGTVTSLTPTLRVSEVPGASHYGFYIRNLDTDALIYVDEFSTVPQHQLPEGVLEPDTRYRWNAQARNCAGFSEYSARFEFQTAPRSTFD